MKKLIFAAFLALGLTGVLATSASAHVDPKSLTIPVYEFASDRDVWVIEGTKVEIRLDEMQHVSYHWEIDHIDGTGVDVVSESHPNTAVLYADMAGSYILTLATVAHIEDPYQQWRSNDVVLKYLDDKGKTMQTLRFHISVRAK